jgi:hypothetical protein
LDGDYRPQRRWRIPRIQLDIAHRIVLEQWLAELFERFDAAASHLVPTAKAKALKPARAREVIAPKRRISGVNLVKAEGEDDWRYWKAAISCLPTEETRDATKLDAAIHSGWREVNAAKLAERVHAELEATLLQPIAIQCRQLGNRPPRP